MPARTVITVALPPSANRLWRYSRGRVHRSGEYTSWLKSAGWEAKAQRPASLPGWVRVKIRAALPEKGRTVDLDNHIKPALDLLETLDIVDDDRLVADVEAHWDRVVAAGKVQIEVIASSDPRRRLSARGRARVSLGVSRAMNEAFGQRAAAMGVTP
jgi:Holliday junction resolvase RusA-like endonuclease